MAEVPNFRQTRRFMGPRWLLDDEGGLLGYALDTLKDAFVERLRLGLMARLPQNDPNGLTTAPDDALSAMGRDRRVVKGLTETSQSYARRLRLWLDDRKRAGNPFALMQKLAEYTGPLPSFRTVDVRGNWYSRAADGTETALLNTGNWNWDNDLSGTRWSRFWVIIYPNGLWDIARKNWGDVTGPGWGGSPLTIGMTATPEEVDTIQFIVGDWKPAGTRCVNIIAAFDPASFNPASPEPDGTWGTWGKLVGGVKVPSRLATARYLDGV
jgi:hypothetical protein